MHEAGEELRMFDKINKRKMSKKKLRLATSGQLAVVALENCADEVLKPSIVSEILEGSKVENNCSTLSKVVKKKKKCLKN